MQEIGKFQSSVDESEPTQLWVSHKHMKEGRAMSADFSFLPDVAHTSRHSFSIFLEELVPITNVNWKWSLHVRFTSARITKIELKKKCFHLNCKDRSEISANIGSRTLFPFQMIKNKSHRIILTLMWKWRPQHFWMYHEKKNQWNQFPYFCTYISVYLYVPCRYVYYLFIYVWVHIYIHITFCPLDKSRMSAWNMMKCIQVINYHWK